MINESQEIRDIRSFASPIVKGGARYFVRDREATSRRSRDNVDTCRPTPSHMSLSASLRDELDRLVPARQCHNELMHLVTRLPAASILHSPTLEVELR